MCHVLYACLIWQCMSAGLRLQLLSLQLRPTASKGCPKKHFKSTMGDLLKDVPHESLSELHNHVLVSKGHFQIHLAEAGLSVTSCVLRHICTILLSEFALSVQLDSEGCDISKQPLSWIF